MATDIFCPKADCKHIRESGLCDASTIGLEFTSYDLLKCINYEALPQEEIERRAE